MRKDAGAGRMGRSALSATMLLFAASFHSPMALGGPLDPGAFASLGTLNNTGGSYTFNTTTDQLLDSNSNVLFTGVTYNGIAVFDFSGINISGGTFTATGSVSSTGMTGRPLALLSQEDIDFTGGSINVSASSPISLSDSGIGGSGGFAGGIGSVDFGTGGGPGGGGLAPAGGDGGILAARAVTAASRSAAVAVPLTTT